VNRTKKERNSHTYLCRVLSAGGSPLPPKGQGLTIRVNPGRKLATIYRPDYYPLNPYMRARGEANSIPLRGRV
jgi:hypothetical protein